MEVPRYQELSGTGTFSMAEASFTSKFLILRNPRWMGALAIIEQADPLNVFHSTPTAWQLRGNLQDGRPVQADSLFETGPTEFPYNIGFSATEGFHIGEPLNEPPLYSEFPLINYYKGSASLNHRGWEIVITESPAANRFESLAKLWQLPFEGVTLRLTCPNSPPEDHENMAVLVRALASLALGTGVSNHRNVFYGKVKVFETWRFMTGNEIGPGLAIPSHTIGNFLVVALPAFESLTPEKQERVRLCITYINLSEIGYLDTRLLTILQAWEFLSSVWVEKKPLSPDLLCLRTRLTEMLREWRKDYVASDPNGFWGSRLASVLDWSRLNDQLQDFAAMWNVDLERIGVDFTTLRQIRNNVAHEGKLPKELPGNTEGRYNILRTARHALRLILLRILGYQDLVMVNNRGFKTFATMEEALSGKYDAV